MSTAPTSSADREPSAGPPWDLPLGEAPLVFVDLEMTGLRPETDRVVEVCLERVRGGGVEGTLLTLVDPERTDVGNAHVHGIDAAALAGAPTFAALAPAVEKLLDGGVLVAHGAAWDVAFLEAELARAGRPRRIPHYVDTLVLARRAFGFARSSLAALCEAFGIPRARAHRAGDDVAALRAVFDRVVGELRPATARELLHVRIGQRQARPEILALLERAVRSGCPVRLRYRPHGRPAAEYGFRPTSLRTDLDPPRVLGYLEPSRSRREFRADRILAVDLETPLGAAAEPDEPGAAAAEGHGPPPGSRPDP